MVDDHDITIPDVFVEDVKNILENLYDFPYLQRHPLAQQFIQVTKRANESGVVHLRREVMTAIEVLSPGPDVPFRSPHARVYNLLHLHYIDGMTVQETALELGISERQTYRDLRRGEESVAAILWSKISKLSPSEGRTGDSSELNHIDRHLQTADLRTFLERAHKAVTQLACQYHVTLKLDLLPEPAVTITESVIAQQVMVRLVSKLIQDLQPDTITVKLTKTPDYILLDTQVQGPANTPATVAMPDTFIRQLLDRLDWTLTFIEVQDLFRIQIPAYNPKLLVIDDNEGLVDLVRRFLADQACHVLAASGGQQGLQKARGHQPDAIILDVMMPDVDGWEVLQTLKAQEQTADIPVIVCSVFNDPELAHSLGAAKFIAKPINRESILDAIHEIQVF